MSGKLTKARREMLADLLSGPQIYVDYYAPIKWAIAEGHVIETASGSSIFKLTESGRALAEQEKTNA